MDSASDTPQKERRPPWPALLSSLLLCLVWMLPDLWTSPLTLPAGEIASMSATKLLAILTWPAAGVIGFAGSLIPLPARGRAAVIVSATTAAVFFGICIEEAFLPADGRYFFAAYLASVAMALVTSRFRKKVVSLVLLWAVPATVLGIHVVAVAKGEYPGAFFGPVKTAVNLWACGWLAAAGFREWSRS